MTVIRAREQDRVQVDAHDHRDVTLARTPPDVAIAIAIPIAVNVAVTIPIAVAIAVNVAVNVAITVTVNVPIAVGVSIDVAITVTANVAVTVPVRDRPVVRVDRADTAPSSRRPDRQRHYEQNDEKKRVET